MTDLLTGDEIVVGEAEYDEDFVLEPEPELDPGSRQFINDLINKIWKFVVAFSGVEMYPYQEEFGKRIIESVIMQSGDTITCEQSRQSGKTEVVANVVASLMVLLPRLAEMFPDPIGGFPGLKKFAKGFWVGTFAPIESQAETLFSRITSRLLDERAREFMMDPEINEDPKPKGGGRYIELRKSKSFCRMQTANPKAKIESKSYHFMVVDEAQDVDERMLYKSVRPMGVAYRASMVMIGTPSIVKGVFYKMIQFNKRAENDRGGKKNHYHYPWSYCARYNPDYKASVIEEALRAGEDSDEFKLNYQLEWLLDRGMFITETSFKNLGDESMKIVHSWWNSPVVVGIDPARVMDSTVVTVILVEWDKVDDMGYFPHRILNWLEIHGDDWEDQYFQIIQFLSNYRVFAIGVDSQGVGDAVADRLAHLLPDIEVVPLGSTLPEQADRWKHMQALVQREMLNWPAHKDTRRTKLWRRFQQQMIDAQKRYQNGHLVVEAPKENNAHDDFVDSAALACILTRDYIAPLVEETTAPWYTGGREDRYERRG